MMKRPAAAMRPAGMAPSTSWNVIFSRHWNGARYDQARSRLERANGYWRNVMIRLTAFRSVPPSVQGLVRDVRVRWALEEAGIPYQEKLVSGAEQRATAAYRAL